MLDTCVLSAIVRSRQLCCQCGECIWNDEICLSNHSITRSVIGLFLGFHKSDCTSSRGFDAKWISRESRVRASRSELNQHRSCLAAFTRTQACLRIRFRRLDASTDSGESLAKLTSTIKRRRT
jgi:hypothetical protein